MKTGFVKQGNKTYFNIEFLREYEDNYKIHMLEENDIPGLLPVCVQKDEGKSKYRYTVTGMTAMETRFELRAIKKEDIEGFVGCLLRTAKALHEFMLNPDGLVLYPRFLFWDNGEWKFCYLPIKKKPLNDEFHALTEYFEERVDDEDKEGIMFIFRLHRATLQNPRDIIKTLKECGIPEESTAQEDEEDDIFKDFESDGGVLIFGEDGCGKIAQPETVTLKETGGFGSIWGRRPDKAKKNRWSLKNLIAESNRQGGEEGI